MKQHQFHLSNCTFQFSISPEDPMSLGVVARNANWCFGHAPAPTSSVRHTATHSATVQPQHHRSSSCQSAWGHLLIRTQGLLQELLQYLSSLCQTNISVFAFDWIIRTDNRTDTWHIVLNELPYLKKGGRIPIDRLQDLKIEDNSIISSTTLIRFSVFKTFCDHSSYYIICLEALFGWNLYDNFRIISIQIGHATFFSNWSQIRESLGILSVVWRTVGVPYIPIHHLVDIPPWEHTVTHNNCYTAWRQ